MDKYVGKKLDGRYQINELLGVGGMAFVYRAYDIIDDRTVAIKILKEEFLNNNEFLRRFRNESKAIAVLSHPNIVKVYDVSFGDKIQYIVMEYIDGITLKQYISNRKDTDWKESVHFAVQILRALQHAHEKGIIHRDIKPQNIMLLHDGTIKVTDFGIARFAKNETRTMTDKAIGSVHYIAPEQARGDITDAKADIYSVGVLLYEFLTGNLPFEADNAVSVAIMQLQANPTPPRQINNEIPEGLEEITLKAMQKDPSKRYQSAAEMLTDIEMFKRNPSIKFQYKYNTLETPSKYIDAIDTVRGTKTDDIEEEPESKERFKKRSAAMSVAVGVGIAVVLVAVIFGILGLTKSCQNSVTDVDIPNFVGKQYNDIIKAKSAGEYQFNFIKEDTKDTSKPDGEILDQNPRPSSNKKVKSNSDIKLVVNATGIQKVTVPDVKALKEADAVEKIKSLGLVPSVISIVDDDTAAGIVKNTDPAANSSVNVGSTVNIYVGKGPSDKKTSMPNVINDSLDIAKKKIETAGLKVGIITERDSNQDKNVVLESDPLPTAPASVGSAVNLVVSSGKQKTTTVEVHVKLPTEINDEVRFKAYVDGKTTVNKVLVPAYNDYYTVSVSGTTGKSTVVVEIDGQEYWTYYVDFDNGGSISDKKNSKFRVTSSAPETTTKKSNSSTSRSTNSSTTTSKQTQKQTTTTTSKSKTTTFYY